jgi:hypothetical protein
MAVNLATKYAKEIANAFAVKSVVDGTTSKDYDFSGVKTLNVYTPSPRLSTTTSAPAPTATARRPSFRTLIRS